jgi:hexosaminidase
LPAGYEISLLEDEIHIAYAGLDDLTLALGDLLTAGKPFEDQKIPPYTFRGIMLDVSRNAVVRVDYLKERIAKLALVGLNRFCLYTEEVFPVPGEPLFGYARGRYTKADIQELVRYGKLFGVVLFPCIQTLGHMEHILKYPHYSPLKDNDTVYNVYAKDLYAFIAKTIDAAVEPYDTDFIHVGMDETFGLGRGLAFREGERIDPRQLYVDHVNKIADICRKKKLKPIMWGDVVLGEAGAEGMDASQTSKLPKDMGMNYWNYAHCDRTKYANAIKDFRKMGFEPTLSPGLWSWSRFFPAYYKAEANIASLLETGKSLGVKSALNTHWGDDGHECLFDLNLPAHTYFLAQCTETKGVESHTKKRFTAVFQADFDAVVSTQEIDRAGYRPKGILPFNTGKCFFYDDPAQGLFSGLPFVKPATATYRSLSKKMHGHAKHKGPFQKYFRFSASFCDFLAIKADLRRRAMSAYKAKNKPELKGILRDIAEAKTRLSSTHRIYRELWLEERSPFGLEIIEGRIGTLQIRLDYLAHILSEYLHGNLLKLEELDFQHFSMFHESRSPDYHPSVWPEFMLHYSALASRNTIKWW